MNWFSAYTWCKAQGMEMIDLNSVCGVAGWGTCSALKLTADEQSKVGTTNDNSVVNWAWTRDSYNAARPWSIKLTTGGISSDRASFGERTQLGRAVCK